MAMLRWSGLCGAMLLVGCSSMYGPPPKLEELPVPFPQTQAERARGGGLFVPHSSTGLLADQRAHRVGDVLTVMLEEVTQASKQANTQTSRSSKLDIAPPVIAGSALKADVGVSAGSKFTGGGSSTQQNALAGSMTVVVQQVLSNGLLHIQGDRSLTLNQGDEVLRLSGYVRASDVDQHNRISSQRVANARISYSGHGALSDASQTGWLSRFFMSPLFPF